ncbi:2-amino-4-hydroxy-6-hydroxymethyldihydropteridine pyrophosphokinase [Candidatus Kinetoplastibacterium desouzaii TCC079E]|uniref:2-amino-4-hydroxy-6-hydroxymethyldihydropteridine pyrophosphokinase n=1 Tax=Candidatus Kinetoplastidibacterium desouzai TCC079E TaxID=1208919 RepID=M1LSL3_9PROT|nr:2-amino-4-hydroxy-6-hydroxymethyldihydropteridine diphosphokinase [Candidatus Kinetoplastibacterium desouzaii]AGF47111.1 2-amino-4-hydroxy-6-hydroxymethyldihydropteridine pyrophosphokinase [Candidatus Kinetoplastibacterium desouzaii TCC079E]
MDNVKTYISLGSNQGNSLKNIEEVIKYLKNVFIRTNCKTSRIYLTEPINADGPYFVNAVMQIYLNMEPFALLKKIQETENIFGRIRSYKNAPRTMDIDILLYGQKIIQHQNLIIPHPRMHERLFVLKPLQDIDMYLEIPNHGKINLLIDKINNQKISVIK